MNRDSLRRLFILFTAGAVAGVLVFPLNPVNSALTRLLFLGSLGSAWLGLLWLLRGNPAVRTLLFVFPVLLALFLALPGRPLDLQKLHTDYIEELRSFEAVTYVWGGESLRGIDCSGLPRRAFRNALFSQAWRTANSKALRLFLSQWWHDASANALSEGYRGDTVPLETTGIMANMDDSELRPGDLAVSLGGAHMLVFLGDGYWIQADPGIGKVATLHHQRDQNSWFQGRVTTHRWSLLCPEEAK